MDSLDKEGNGGNLSVAEVLVRKVPDDQQSIDLRVAVLGNADVGKSTLIGVLTQGQLDNGRGLARLNMFRHLHEVQSGRTSCVSHEILGFDSVGEVVDYGKSTTAEEICENSSKLITFVDLAGHHKYLRTTIRGLTSYAPHYVMLVVSGSAGVVGTTREHLGLALALEVPFFVVITKQDVTRPQVLTNTLQHLDTLLKGPGCNKVPLHIETEDDVITAGIHLFTFDFLKTNLMLTICLFDFHRRHIAFRKVGAHLRRVECDGQGTESVDQVLARATTRTGSSGTREVGARASRVPGLRNVSSAASRDRPGRPLDSGCHDG